MQKRIVDVGSTAKRIDPNSVALALGAEPAHEVLLACWRLVTDIAHEASFCDGGLGRKSCAEIPDVEMPCHVCRARKLLGTDVEAGF